MTTTAIAETIGASEHHETTPAPGLAVTPLASVTPDEASRLRDKMFLSVLLAVQVAWLAGLAYAAWLVLV
jgi:hypothetical protein